MAYISEISETNPIDQGWQWNLKFLSKVLFKFKVSGFF